MYEKVNPAHPDKVMDRIAGALVDYVYFQEKNPRIAVEGMIGHRICHIIAETSVHIPRHYIIQTVRRIAGSGIIVDYVEVPQDDHLARNQAGVIRCGDNGIFKGMPVTEEQRALTDTARRIYRAFPCDGKYILNGAELVICQSNACADVLKAVYPGATVNPLGDWSGGPDVDTGAINRKLGSDMGDAVTGGGLHGKDLSKADVSVNIYAHMKAQSTGKPVELCCAIGDVVVDGRPYSEIVELARAYIQLIGGFEKFAEWGLIR